MLLGKKRRKKVSGGVSFVLKGRILLRQAQSVYVTKMELVYPSNGVMLHSGSRAMIKKIKKKERFSPYKIRTLRAQVYSLHTPVLVCHFSFSINGFMLYKAHYKARVNVYFYTFLPSLVIHVFSLMGQL